MEIISPEKEGVRGMRGRSMGDTLQRMFPRGVPGYPTTEAAICGHDHGEYLIFYIHKYKHVGALCGEAIPGKFEGKSPSWGIATKMTTKNLKSLSYVEPAHMFIVKVL